jgi:signal transduction histidine kinase
LQSNEFNAGAYHRGRNGKLYFGGVYGLNIIEPDKLKPVANDAEVVITSMDVLGSEVQVKPDRDIKEEEKGIYQVTEEEGKFTLPVSISYAKAIKLNYRHRFLALEFAALKCPVGATNRFAYRMENLDMGWTHAGTRNYISFANMDAGTYVLNVKAQNSDGQWSPHQARLSIIITPPFYRTWWFMMFEFLFALGISLLIYHYLVKAKTNRLLKRQNRQIAEANRQLTESEHNLLELNATKDKFFSIIAHDLKNPFTSLLSITDLLLEDFEHADEEDKHLGMKRVNDAIKEIYSLLENLLTWSRAQTGRINFEPRPFNLSNVVYENINLHRVPAERKGIHLQTELEENIMAFGDRDMINTVVRNLLSNAVKFTSEGKKIAVKVKKNSHDVEVRVKDEGLGIAKENLNMLFRIDMKFKSKGTHGERGTGLGLILCKEFIERHGGKIGVKSKVDKGSTFYFTIPVTPEIIS